MTDEKNAFFFFFFFCSVAIKSRYSHISFIMSYIGAVHPECDFLCALTCVCIELFIGSIAKYFPTSSHSSNLQIYNLLTSLSAASVQRYTYRTSE